MKKLFTLLLISIFAINTTCAQVEGEGTWILGATTELSNAPWSQIAMQPTIGYFISDNMAVGLGFSLASSSQDTEMPDLGNGEYTITNSTSDMSIGPWMRYYLGEMMFVNAGVALGSGSTKWSTTESGADPSSTTDKTASMDLEIGAGASILWGDHIAFEPMFGLSMGNSSVTPHGGDKIKGPSTMNVGFKIGVCVMLGN